jgi:hypothetical protein
VSTEVLPVVLQHFIVCIVQPFKEAKAINNDQFKNRLFTFGTAIVVIVSTVRGKIEWKLTLIMAVSTARCLGERPY